MSGKRGVCATCRRYKCDKAGSYCEYGVADRTRGPGQEPCGWWKPRRKVKR